MADKKRKEVELETKVIAWMSKSMVGTYSCRLFQVEGKEVAFEIFKTTDEGELKWNWYLSSLLGVWGEDGISDKLSLDWGMEWYVKGMKKAIQEAMSKISI